mgnify:CR=1 FL=1|jgi:hypothetical protein
MNDYKYFNVQIKSDVIQRNGSVKQEKDHLLVRAVSVSDAETQVIKRFENSDEFQNLEVISVGVSKITNVIPEMSGENYLNTTVIFEYENENGSTKESKDYYLVISDLKNAENIVNKSLNHIPLESRVSSISESKISYILDYQNDIVD